MTPEPSLVEVSDEPLSPTRSSSVSESEDEFEYASTETTAPLMFLNAFEACVPTLTLTLLVCVVPLEF